MQNMCFASRFFKPIIRCWTSIFQTNPVWHNSKMNFYKIIAHNLGLRILDLWKRYALSIFTSPGMHPLPFALCLWPYFPTSHRGVGVDPYGPEAAFVLPNSLCPLLHACSFNFRLPTGA